MINYLPSPKNYKETFNISIEGQQFTVTYQYNSRSDTWYLGLYKDGVAVLNNVKLTQGYKLGYNYVGFPLTMGTLYVYSPTGVEDTANLSNFGNSVFLVYESN